MNFLGRGLIFSKKNILNAKCLTYPEKSYKQKINFAKIRNCKYFANPFNEQILIYIIQDNLKDVFEALLWL